MNKCILYEDRQECIHCGDCRCDLDPDKICDNCMECVTGNADYRAISITDILMPHEEISPGSSRQK